MGGKVAGEDEGLPRVEEPELGDRALLALVAAGHRPSFRLLFERHGATVLRYAVSFDADLGLDASQEAWLALWRARGRLVLEEESIVPWLLVVTRRLVLRALTRERRSSAQELVPSDETDPLELVILRHRLSQVERCVSEMSAIDRAVFDLCFRAGLSHREVGESLRITEQAARNRVFRIRQRLRAIPMS